MDKILLPDAYKVVPLVDSYVDDFWSEDTTIWTTSTENSGTTTGAASVMTITTGTTDANGVYLSTEMGTLGVNKAWEATVRFRTHTAAAGYLIGWIVNASVGVNAQDDTTEIPLNAFQGIYIPSADLRAVLYAKGDSETAQSKQLDWVVTASSAIWRTVRLQLVANRSGVMSLYVWADQTAAATNDPYYPETTSRWGVNDFKPVRGYNDSPVIPFAYLENITAHAGSHSFIAGVKTQAAAAATMSLDYVALAKTR